jgi:hypothetical protein
MARMPKIALPKLKLPRFGKAKAAPGEDTSSEAAEAIAGRGGDDGRRRKLAGKHIVGFGAIGLVVLGAAGFGIAQLFSSGEEPAEAEIAEVAPAGGGSVDIPTIATEMPDGTIHFGPRAELRLPPKPRPGERSGADPEPSTAAAEPAPDEPAPESTAETPQLLAPPQPDNQAESGDSAVASGSGDGLSGTAGQAAAETAAAEPPPQETFVAPPARATGEEPPQPQAAPSTPVTVASILPPEPVYPETPPRFSDLVTFTTNPDPLAPLDPALTERAPQGDLPRVASDGREAWRHYARPVPQSVDASKPRIAIIIARLGPDKAATETAIRNLPPEVTLAFASTERSLSRWVTLAREIGHEVVIDLPMEPNNFPLNDPGPNTLLTTVPDKENIERLEATLSAANGYVGVAAVNNGKFVANREKLLPVLAALKERGLMILDATREGSRQVAAMSVQAGAPTARADVILDRVPTRKAIDAKLRELEQVARATGLAVAVGHPYPSTFERLVNWIELARKAGFEIVPLSALANKQKII